MDQYQTARDEMVRFQIEDRGIHDPEILQAMRKVPRHLFVLHGWLSSAYDDSALPFKEGQTISQPYIVALMTDALNLNRSCSVLEIGTGTGYQTAVLAEIAEQVYTIERIGSLLDEARTRLKILGYENIRFYEGDGTAGWPGENEFDRIIITAAADRFPVPLARQLKTGGIMVIPQGSQYGPQYLYRAEKQKDGSILKENLLPVRFVPLISDG